MAISYFQNELKSENAKPETLFIFAHLHPNSVLKFSKENCEIIPVIWKFRDTEMLCYGCV